MNKINLKTLFVILAGLSLMLGLPACESTSAVSTSPVVPKPPTPSAAVITEPPQPPATETPTLEPPTPTTIPPTETPLGPAVLPPEPKPVDFQAEDGQVLQGSYYPAAVNPAPLIVLMHWAGGDQNDWVEIAFWLQNRGLGGQSPNPADSPWLDPSWFPILPEGSSYAVFTFSFRGCNGGCQGFPRDKWLLDAQAAMAQARQLEGVDPLKIVALGASIGADGAADGCFFLNSQYPNSCLGALSLSPGNYLTMLYTDAVSALGADEPARPAWCLYSEGDTESETVCSAIQEENYTLVEFPGDAHGMMLLSPETKPDPLKLIFDFLNQVLG